MNRILSISLFTGCAAVACAKNSPSSEPMGMAPQANETPATTPAVAAPESTPPSSMPIAAKTTKAPTPSAEMGKVLAELASLGGKPIESLTAAEARKQPTPTDAVKALLKKEGKSTAPEEVAKVENRKIPSGAVRIYTPKTGKAPFPVVVYYHGGGFVIADLDVYDASPRALANGSGAVVVSVEYRKAPENKFPAAHNDAFAAYQWVLKNTASFAGDPKRIAVAGESAGGNLAASVSIAARDKGLQLPVHQLLVYPVASSDTDAPSYVTNADAKPLNKPMMLWFVDKYLRSPADGKDPRINLVSANLKGLPPTTIINAEIDPLLSDGEKLAEALKAAGVKTTQKTYPGVAHEFFGMGAVVSGAKDAEAFGASHLKAAFEK